MPDNLFNNTPFKINLKRYEPLKPARVWHAPMHEIAPPAIVWGGTIGFGWEVIRYLELGDQRWEEAILVAIPSTAICFGIFYLRIAWRSRKNN